MKVNHRITPQQQRKSRVRKALFGTAVRPRLCVVRTNQHIYVQAINDDQGTTLVNKSDAGKKSKADLKGKTKTQRAEAVAKLVGENLKKKSISSIVFDRGNSRYHGRVKAIAETLREMGIQF